jgi:hypothetical protein
MRKKPLLPNGQMKLTQLLDCNCLLTYTKSISSMTTISSTGYSTAWTPALMSAYLSGFLLCLSPITGLTLLRVDDEGSALRKLCLATSERYRFTSFSATHEH